MMKYYYYTIEFRDGDNEYSDSAVIACHHGDYIEQVIKKYILAKMFSDGTIEEDGVFWREDYCVAVKLRSVRQISKAHFMVLKQYLLHDIIEPEPEKVSFT